MRSTALLIGSLFLALPCDARQASPDLHDRAAAVFGAPDHEFVQLALPAGGPRTLMLDVVRHGRRRTLSMVRTPVRAASFQVLVYGADGSLTAVTPEPELTYSGIVLGQQGSLVSASLDSQGMTAVVVEGQETWRVLPLRRIDPRASRRAHLVTGEREGIQSTLPCGMGLTGGGGSGNGPVVSPPHVGVGIDDASRVRCISQADIGFDCDYEYYLAQGGTVTGTVATVQAYVGLNNTMYARDVQIRHRLTAVIVRTAPFYFPTDGGDLLNLFRNEWNNNQSAIPRDLAHLMTGKPGSLIQYGGLAWVSVVCNTAWAYAWSMDSAGIVGHETGHNWGAGHCADPSPCNNMCGACLWVGPNTRDIIQAYRDGVTCLWQSGSFEEPVPPYIYPVGATLDKTKMITKPAVFDVLAGAEDGNCEPVSLQAFDATSALGVPIVLSPGTGPDGRDELIYSPTAPVLGTDSFTFTAGDPSGLTTVGTVAIEIPLRAMEGYWPLTEGTGETAGDATGHGHAGALKGGAGWTSGPFGGAVSFDGINDHIGIPSVGVFGDEVTLSAWIRHDGNQTAWAGLIHTQANGEDAGLMFGPGGELRYIWAGDANTSAWDSGIVPPAGQWVFVALVIRPQSAVIHMHDGTAATKSTFKYDHSRQTFAGTTRLGWYSADPTYRFRGDMADVRVYGRALGKNDIDNLVLLGGTSEAPEPREGTASGVPLLQWTSGVGTMAHHVYLGTDYLTVRKADQTSPEYQGSVAQASFSLPALTQGIRYYWRVDEENWGQTLKGEVWMFDLPRFHHWALDEISGTVAVDSGEGLDGGYKGGFLLGQPGATSKTGTSVLLDGTNGRMRIPAMNLNDNHATITAWIKRSGNQPDWAGLVFSRAGNTVAGLGLGLNHELRFHWNDNGYLWASQQVVPDNRWVFVAMVVDPAGTTLYMGDNGVLTSSNSPIPRLPEEFDAATLVGRDGTGGRVFKGGVDDVRFIRGSLTRSQVLALYQATL